MKIIGVNILGYNQRRNISDLQVQGYSFRKVYDLFKVANHLYYLKNKYTHPYYNFSFQDFDFNRCDLLHFFNSISFGKKPWVVTIEERVPRWGNVSRQTLQKGIKLLAGDACVKIIPFSKHAMAAQLEQLENYPELAPLIIPKMEVIYPSQRALISSWEEKELDPDHLVCTIVGSDFFRKGGKEVLSAFSILLEEKYPVKLNIVSRLEYGDYASRTTESDYREAITIIERYPTAIRWFKSLPNSEVLQLFKNSHIGLLPTYDDTFGYSVLEAQAAGCPVISTDIRALPEINDASCGWLIEVSKNSVGKGLFAVEAKRVEMARIITNYIYETLRALCSGPGDLIRQKGEKAIDRIQRLHNPYAAQLKMKSIYDGALS